MKFPSLSRPVLLASVLALAVLAYIQSFSHQFVLDDHDLLQRIVVQMGSVFDAWRAGSAFQSYYRPLLITSLYIDNALAGDSAVWYHVVNVLLHCGVVWGVFLLAERLFASARTAALVALLFALHPAHTENVSWVSGRTDLLAGVFGIFALVCFYDLVVRRNRRAGWIAAALFFFAMMSKEIAVIVPVMAIVFLLVRGWMPIPAAGAAVANTPLRRGKSARRTAERENEQGGIVGSVIQVFLLFGVSIGIFLIMRSAVAKDTITENVFTTTMQVWMNAARCLAMYVWHAVAGGGYEYIIRGWRVAQPRFNLQLPDSDDLIWYAIGATVLAVIAALVLAIRAKRPLTVFGLSGFIIGLVPALGFVPIQSIYSVRFLYLPSLFLIIAAVDAVRWAGEKFRTPLFMRAAAAVGCAVAAWWGVQTFTQDAHWTDDVTLMQSMKAGVSESPIYYFTLGNGYRYRGDFMEAANQFERATMRYREYFDAHVNLAGCYMMLGQTHPEYYTRALAVIDGALTVYPLNARLVTMMGDTYLAMGDIDHAKQNYVAAYRIQRSPDIRARLDRLHVPIP